MKIQVYRPTLDMRHIYMQAQKRRITENDVLLDVCKDILKDENIQMEETNQTNLSKLYRHARIVFWQNKVCAMLYTDCWRDNVIIEIITEPDAAKVISYYERAAKKLRRKN